MNAPRITMVGHAGVVFDLGATVVWTDPWLHSLAFSDSWAIHPEPVIADDLLDRVTHIWISHEHPDHFNIPTLRSLPGELRDRVVVLVQQHFKTDVMEFLRAEGFNVVEMAAGRPTPLADGSLTCHPVGPEDSALVVEADGLTMLNLNDCKPTDRELRRICRRHGQIDLLLDQFSGAGWNGNPGDRERKLEQAQLIRKTFDRHLRVVKPRHVLPFASFVRFAHTESAHLGQQRVTLDEVILSNPRQPFAVLYPGDTWSLDEAWNGSDDARSKYRADDASTDSIPLVSGDPVASIEIIAAAEAMVERLKASFHSPIRRLVPTIRFLVADNDTAVCDLTVSLTRGVLADDPDEAATTVVLGSEAALNAFVHPWGLTTLVISGRFAIDGPEGPFFRMKQLAAAEAAGYRSRRSLSLVTNRRFRSMFLREIGHQMPALNLRSRFRSAAGRARGQVLAPLLRRHGDRVVPAVVARRSSRIDWMRKLARWWRHHQSAAEVLPHREALWDHVRPDDWHGDYLEFGVFLGESLAWWSANTPPDVRLFGFDTFTGLPEDWGDQSAGSYSAEGRLPDIDDDRIEYVVGIFSETVEPFLAITDLRHPLVVHLDADLYESTLQVLKAMAPRLEPGDVVVFDELLDVGTADHEFRALIDATTETGLQYEVVAAVHGGRQAALRII